MWACDIAINLLSDCLCVLGLSVLLAFSYLLTRKRRSSKALRFFHFSRDNPLKIYVPSFEHPHMSSKATVTVLEYESAAEMRRRLEELTRAGIIEQIQKAVAGFLGQEWEIPSPNIEVSPLNEVPNAPYRGTVISIGGPVTNQVTKFYLRDSPQYRWDFSGNRYQERIDGEYRDIEPSGDVAVVEKRIINNQVVFLAHGYGEKDTARAAQYLINTWDRLYQSYGEGRFGIRV